MRRNRIVLALVAVWLPLSVFGQETEWRAGFGRANITPDEPAWMYGYAARDHPSEGVRAEIFAKALVLEDQAGQRSVLCTADLGAIDQSFADAVHARVSTQVQIPRERFLFTCSHNHSGPILSRARDRDDSSHPDRRRAIAAYTRTAEEKLTKAILQAIDDLQPARLSWGVGVAPFVMNRREFTPRGIILGVNPRGSVDRSVPVLRVASADGALRGVVFGCACHNTSLSQRNYLISGDYAGFAQAYVEDRLPDVQAMFVTGCGADANPYPRGETPAGGSHDEWFFAEQHGRTLGVEVCRVLESELELLTGPLRVARGVAELPYQRHPDRERLQEVAEGRSRTAADTARSLLQLLEAGQPLPTHEHATVTVWQFGDGMTLVALSGEVVSEYVPLIEQALGHRNLWIAAYAHDVFGYVTTARIQREGGYEAKGVSGRGLFAEDAQDAYVATVKQLADQAGRDISALRP